MERIFLLRDFMLRYRRCFAALLQFSMVIISFWAAYVLRFDLHVPPLFLNRFLDLLPAVLAIKLFVFWKFGLFKGWWRYVSMADLLTIFKANLLASLAVLVYAVLVYRLEYVPRTVLVMDGTLSFLLIGGVRFCVRAFRENYFPMHHYPELNLTRVLVVGAGDAGQMIVREIRQNPRLKKQVIGFVDDNPGKRGLQLQGFPVLGGHENIGALCQKFGVDEVIIAIPSASGAQMRKIVEKCHSAMVKFKTLPGVSDLIDGRVSVQHIKDVDVEDLLGREPVRLDSRKIRAYITGKRVLITGAGGSIGSELCRQAARFSPARILLFDNSETPLFQTEQEISGLFPEIPLRAVLGDIRNRTRVEAIFEEFMPEVVFHAAAYKHVPMLEYNPAEAVDNNIRGTKIVADTAHAFGVQKFVMISSDKAVNPTNIMGATKRGAELYVQTLARRSRTTFITVRFGNVLGSSGSVVPTFKEQIKRGGPVTVTHPEVTRFFMTIPEAAQLVLQAGSMGRGGEVFLLDMGAPMRILHLAEELIRLSGLRPYEDIDITFTGLRPGEKLHEELLLAGEGTLPTSHEKIMMANAACCNERALHQQMEDLFKSARAMDLATTIDILKKIVPEYRETVNPVPGKVYLHPAVNQSVAISSENSDMGHHS